MKRPLLLLASTALALLVACGVALAATAIDCAVVGNPCNGTKGDDQITGTTDADTISARGGNDQISALDANDTLRGQGGTYTINGQLGNDILSGGLDNDTMDGGDGNDRYKFSDNFGPDRIEADSSGVDTIDLSQISIPCCTNPYDGFYEGISVDLQGPDPLCSSTPSRCISLGGEFIENLVGTPFEDNL